MNLGDSISFLTAFALSVLPFGGHALGAGLSSSVITELQGRGTFENGILFVHAIYASDGFPWRFSEPFHSMDGFVYIAQYATSIKFTSGTGTKSLYAIECSNPVWALNHGKELSQTYDERTELVTGHSDTNNWRGDVNQMNNQCIREMGTPGNSIRSYLFDACGNYQEGLHIWSSGFSVWWGHDDAYLGYVDDAVDVYLGFQPSFSSDCYGNSIRVDVDECTLGTHTCDVNAFCTNTDGSFTCECNEGYSGSGYFWCTDIDECAEGTDGCDANALCTNTHGYYTCACNSGYYGDGFTCTDDDECTSGTHSCDTNAFCTNTAGSYTCECNDGYQGDGYACSDIDKCALGTDECSDNAICTNIPGSYGCECNSGYSGNGFACTDDDECTLGTHDCKGQGVECINVAGSFECVCTNVVDTVTSCLQGALQCNQVTPTSTGLIEQQCQCVAGAVVPYSYMYIAAFLLVLSYVELYFLMKICCFANTKRYAAVNVKYSDSDIESESQVINIRRF